MRDYFLAKAALFTPERSRRGIVCVDDEWGRELADAGPVPVTTLTSLRRRRRRLAGRAGERRPGRRSRLSDGTTTLHLRSALPGDFNRVNTAMAALALMAGGIDPQDAERALLVDPHVPGRMERVDADAGTAPTSACRSSSSTTPTPPTPSPPPSRRCVPRRPGRLVVVLGAGGDRDRGKRAAMGEPPRAGPTSSSSPTTTPGPRTPRRSAPRSSTARATPATPPAARRRRARGGHRRGRPRRPRAGPGSVVAVVGKGHETGQEIAGTVHPFDDRDEAVRPWRHWSRRPPAREVAR